MKFEFSQYQYQTDAANAACDVFEGQPKQSGVSFIRDLGVRSKPVVKREYSQPTAEADFGGDAPTRQALLDDDELNETGYRNADVQLSSEQVLDNIHIIQKQQNLVQSQQLFHEHGAVELDVEMETGTG
jgi:type III restriction enzyme